MGLFAKVPVGIFSVIYRTKDRSDPSLVFSESQNTFITLFIPIKSDAFFIFKLPI